MSDPIDYEWNPDDGAPVSGSSPDDLVRIDILFCPFGIVTSSESPDWYTVEINLGDQDAFSQKGATE